MYLSELKLWNFRKYGIKEEEFENSEPGLVIQFNLGLNVLIGENDSGKTAIVDAIRYVLGTHSREWVSFEETDFHRLKNIPAEKFKIECVFRGFKHKEAGYFLEWMGFEEINGKQEYVLSVRLTAQRKGHRIIPDLRAGPDSIGIPIEGEAKDRLRATYLKPLRDAESELIPGRRSRLAQILAAHSLFQKVKGEDHDLERILKEANQIIENYFNPSREKSKGREIMKNINALLEGFFPQNESPSAAIRVSGGELSDILHRLELAIQDNPAGLGTLNRLYMAAELLLLQSPDYDGLRLALIEELEAHLHPQAQLNLIHYFQKNPNIGQYILSTHSTTLGASIDLKNLIICKGDQVFPMGPDYTELAPKNYEFLQRFLDATKANLFFARGVILVEGDAENLLLPTIAKIVGRPLHRYGVSIVNVGSKAFLHYAKIFSRKVEPNIGIKVAIITDIDVTPYEHKDNKNPLEDINKEKQKKIRSLTNEFDKGETRCFVAPDWTLEYEIALSGFCKRFYKSVLWAEKKQNAKSGIPQDNRWSEVEDAVEADLKAWKAQWKNDDRQRERIALEICKKILVDSKLSKAITAQVFAESLEESFQIKSEKIRACLLRQKSLGYLVEAICHVTEPLEKTEDGSDN